MSEYLKNPFFMSYIVLVVFFFLVSSGRLKIKKRVSDNKPRQFVLPFDQTNQDQ